VTDCIDGSHDFPHPAGNERLVKIPLEINGEWQSLGSSDDIEGNLRSITLIRVWLEGTERVLRERGANDKDPIIYRHPRRADVAGLTSSEFDGIEMGTLRSWHIWWSETARNSHGREEAGRDPQTEAEKVRAEIEARGGTVSGT
jgi:hypothetical protein